MTRVALIALVLLTLVPAAASATGPTTLAITIWPDEREAVTRKFTLGCGPVRGTLPRAAAACTRLATGGAALFAPLPKDIACTDVYGGPQRAIVTGTVNGRRIWVSLRRRDGCEIDRWRRLAFLLPISLAGPA